MKTTTQNLLFFFRWNAILAIFSIKCREHDILEGIAFQTNIMNHQWQNKKKLANRRKTTNQTSPNRKAPTLVLICFSLGIIKDGRACNRSSGQYDKKRKQRKENRKNMKNKMVPQQKRKKWWPGELYQCWLFHFSQSFIRATFPCSPLSDGADSIKISFNTWLCFIAGSCKHVELTPLPLSHSWALLDSILPLFVYPLF